MRHPFVAAPPLLCIVLLLQNTNKSNGTKSHRDFPAAIKGKGQTALGLANAKLNGVNNYPSSRA